MTNETVFRLHNVTDKEAWKFSTETWVLKIGDEQKLETAQMRFLRQLLGITKLDRERNKSVRDKSGVQNIVREIQQCQQKRLQHLHKMDTNRIPKQTLQYKSEGKRNIESPRKRWKDQLRLD
jgi:hypothetical protein